MRQLLILEYLTDSYKTVIDVINNYCHESIFETLWFCDETFNPIQKTLKISNFADLLSQFGISGVDVDHPLKIICSTKSILKMMFIDWVAYFFIIGFPD